MSRWFLLCALPGCVLADVHRGNGESLSEDRELTPFSGIVSAISIPVDVRGGTPSAEVTCDSNLVDLIVLDVQGGDLVIHTLQHGHSFAVIDPKTDCRVSIAVPGLERLTAAGSGTLTAAGDVLGGLHELTSTGSGGLDVQGRVVADEVSATNTGSGELSIDAIEATDTTLLSSGSGGMSVLGGSTDSLSLTTTGSGEVDASGLVAAEVNATLTGSGGASVTATDSLTGTITGSGDLVVFGDPGTRDVSASGSGEAVYE